MPQHCFNVNNAISEQTHAYMLHNIGELLNTIGNTYIGKHTCLCHYVCMYLSFLPCHVHLGHFVSRISNCC